MMVGTFPPHAGPFQARETETENLDNEKRIELSWTYLKMLSRLK
jgi:hypothetical protein